MLERVYWWYKLEIGISREEAMALCYESLTTLVKPYKLQTSDRSAFEIVAKTRWSWRGFGELIWIKVSKMPPPMVRIDISSHPYMQELAWDLGGNRRNIEGIVNFITSHVEPDKISLIEIIRPKSEIVKTR